MTPVHKIFNFPAADTAFNHLVGSPVYFMHMHVQSSLRDVSFLALSAAVLSQVNIPMPLEFNTAEEHLVALSTRIRSQLPFRVKLVKMGCDFLRMLERRLAQVTRWGVLFLSAKAGGGHLLGGSFSVY